MTAAFIMNDASTSCCSVRVCDDDTTTATAKPESGSLISTTSTSTTTSSNSSVRSCLKQVSDISETTSETSTTGSSGIRHRRRRRVGFTTLDVYEFPQILGDNPGVSAGAPLALAPVHSKHAQIDVAFFEYRRKPRKSNKRELVESREVREEYLKSQGYSASDIEQAATEAARISKSRERNCKNHKLVPGHDAFFIVWESIAKRSSLMKKNKESASKLLRRHEACRAA